MCVCVCVCVRMCVYVCVHVCVCAFVCVCQARIINTEAESVSILGRGAVNTGCWFGNLWQERVRKYT